MIKGEDDSYLGADRLTELRESERPCDIIVVTSNAPPVRVKGATVLACRRWQTSDSTEEFVLFWSPGGSLVAVEDLAGVFRCAERVGVFPSDALDALFRFFTYPTAAEDVFRQAGLAVPYLEVS